MPKLLLRLLLVGLVGLLVACGGSEKEAQEPVQFTNVTMTLFRPFATGEYVFRSRVELDSALSAAPFRVFPIGLVLTEPSIPDWDFQSSMIVGLSLGLGAWCTAPRIIEVLSDGTSMVVRYEVWSSGTLACMKLAPLIAFVQVPQVAGPVEFRRIDVTPNSL